MSNDKELVYCNRVRIGNWYEASTLEEYKLNKFLEQMKRGDLMLARYRSMTENLNSPTTLTQTSGSITFGSKISLLAPHAPGFWQYVIGNEPLAGCSKLHAAELQNLRTILPTQEPKLGSGLGASDPPVEGKTGLLLGGRISSNQIAYSQELEDGFSVVAIPGKTPAERNTFIITSADYCDRTGEQLKFNQEFLLMLSSSQKKKPLYVRYDPDPIPGLCGSFPLLLSQNAVSNTRWRILPAQSANITRFEQEGKAVMVNTDIIVNHCATNLNLGTNPSCWAMGFYGPVCAPLMKTCLDVYGKELPNNIWQIYIPIAGDKVEE